MTLTTPLTNKKSLSGNSLLGFALAGISCLSQQAGAASVFTEVTDFGNETATATDLSAEFINFAEAGGIIGKITLDNLNSDFADYLIVNASASTVVNFPFTCMSSSGSGAFGFASYTTTGTYIASQWISANNAGETYAGTLSFSVPANGKVVIRTNTESGNTTFNYTLGAVPEPSTGLMSLAAIAAAALRRRREAL